MINKKGAIPAPWIAVGGVIVFLLLIFAIGQTISYFENRDAPVKQTLAEKIAERESIADVTGSSSLNFLTYVFGGIPKALIDEVGGTPAIIIIIAIFIMLVVSFGDILATFSAFSQTTSWILASLLALVAANLKVIMLIAVWSFGIVAGVGVISVGIGLLIPFLTFILMHYFFASYAAKLAASKTKTQITANVGKATTMMQGLRDMANAMKNP